jgi:hypothetical protein
MTTESEIHILSHFVKDYWPVILSVIGFVVSILVILKGKLPQLEEKVIELQERIRRMEGIDFVKKNVVYDKDNQVKFQSLPACVQIREECHMQQKQFQNNFCKAVDKLSDEVRLIVRDADSKRESTRKEITDMNQRLIELMTQMRNLIDKDRSKELKFIIESTVKQVIQFHNSDHNQKLLDGGK